MISELIFFHLECALIPIPEPTLRRFVDIANLDTEISFLEKGLSTIWPMSRHRNTTCYEVGKLAFDLLPVLLSRIEPLESPEVHDVTVCL